MVTVATTTMRKNTLRPSVLDDAQASRRRLLVNSLTIASMAPLMASRAAIANGTQTTAQAAQHLPGATALANHWRHDDNAIALVMLALPRCPVCKIVRDQQLLPLTRDTTYQDIGVFEILMTDDTHDLPLAGKLNPDGSRLTPKAFAKRLGLRVSPSLVFLNRRYMLAEPLIGYSSPDYYWAYLSERIENARQAIKMSS